MLVRQQPIETITLKVPTLEIQKRFAALNWNECSKCAIGKVMTLHMVMRVIASV